MQDQIPLGAHLVTPRWGYVHHGVYIGAGRVIHYAGFTRSFRRKPVEEVSLDQFVQKRGFSVKACVDPKFSGEAAVHRARSRLGEDRYGLWSNNCEHFAEWCISETSRSLQVNAWKERIRKQLAVFRRNPVRSPSNSSLMDESTP